MNRLRLTGAINNIRPAQADLVVAMQARGDLIVELLERGTDYPTIASLAMIDRVKHQQLQEEWENMHTDSGNKQPIAAISSGVVVAAFAIIMLAAVMLISDPEPQPETVQNTAFIDDNGIIADMFEAWPVIEEGLMQRYDIIGADVPDVNLDTGTIESVLTQRERQQQMWMRGFTNSTTTPSYVRVKTGDRQLHTYEIALDADDAPTLYPPQDSDTKVRDPQTLLKDR